MIGFRRISDEQVDLVEKVCDILEAHPEVKENEITKIRSDEDLKRIFINQQKNT